MSSSTSNSRAPFGRILLVTFFGMAASMGLVRLFTYANDVSGDTILRRVVEARAALPRIVAEENDLVMAFGSSMTEAGFAARQFDRELTERGIDVTSFNFGFGGLNPLFQDYLARRVREAFEAEDRRLKLALIEFCPFQNTVGRYQGALPVVDSFVTMLASPREMWEVTLSDPTRGIRMLNIHYLRDDISAEMITHHFGEELGPPTPRSSLPEDEVASKRLGEVSELLSERFEEDYPDYADEDWHYGWQGAGTIPEERSASTRALFEELYELLRSPRRLENDKLRRATCCDIETLDFEEELVAAFVRMVETFQAFSDRVEVVLLPRNTAWIQYEPDAAARLEAVLDRIARETGVVIRNHQDLDGVTPEMFSDTTHLARYSGDVAYTSFLVETYAPLLAEIE